MKTTNLEEMRIAVETYYEEVGALRLGRGRGPGHSGDPALLSRHESRHLELASRRDTGWPPAASLSGAGQPCAHRHLMPFDLVFADLPAPDAAGEIGDHRQEVR